jgi:hypothetical protein
MNQLVGFGSEKHDDLVDALVYLLNAITGHTDDNDPCTFTDDMERVAGASVE